MPCPGLHCPGCSGRQSLGVLGGLVVVVYIADRLSVWVAEHIWEIGLTVGACFVLAVAASMALESWADRRGARFAQRHGILSRADVILPPVVRASVISPEPPAIAPQVVNNYFIADADQAAAIIRHAITEGK